MRLRGNFRVSVILHKFALKIVIRLFRLIAPGGAYEVLAVDGRDPQNVRILEYRVLKS